MKEWKIKFKEELYNNLKEYLFSTSPLENGCFILGKAKDNILFVKEFIIPDSDSFIERNEDLCVPSPQYIAHASSVADEKGLSLVFIHTHPADNHPSTFSVIDKISNKKLFDNLGGFLREPMGSLVMSQKGLHGVIFNKGKIEPIQDFSIYGKGVMKIVDSSNMGEGLDSLQFDRQLKLMQKSQVPLAKLKIAVVGLGGIGSPLSIMLAKMGCIC